MSLYLWINILSIAVPLLVSFHPKIQLYKQWKYLFPAILMAMIPFIVWDVYFTDAGYWGFNPAYLSGIYFLDLPIEEWMFFVAIPYACIFTHISLLTIYGQLALSSRITQRITALLLIIFALIGVRNYNQAYTLVDIFFGFIVLLIVHFSNPKILNSFYVTFLVMLVPFFVVNGILTGTGIEGEVVWYNDAENLGVRIFTIPVEDTVYAFSLILLNLFLFEVFKKWK